MGRGGGGGGEELRCSIDGSRASIHRFERGVEFELKYPVREFALHEFFFFFRFWG